MERCELRRHRFEPTPRAWSFPIPNFLSRDWLLRIHYQEALTGFRRIAC